MCCQISFRRNPFSGAPALMLIDAENGYDLLGRQAFLFGEELPDVRTVTLTPEIFQSLGRTELVPGVSRSRRGLGLELIHDAISHRAFSRCRWADFSSEVRQASEALGKASR